MKKFYYLFMFLLLDSLLTGCSASDRQAVAEVQENIQTLKPEKEELNNVKKNEEVVFHGLTVNGETPKLGFQNVNSRGNVAGNYFCVDSETGKIYYVNAGKDNYLYCLDGNKKTLVLKKYVDCINVLDGVLYFRYGKNLQYNPDIQNSCQGKAYSYDLETKKLTRLTEDKITWIGVSEEGLYCHFGFDSPKYGKMLYFSEFGTDEWKPALEDAIGVWLGLYKNYMLKLVVDEEGNYQKTVWMNRETKEEVDFFKAQLSNGFLYKDHVYVSIYLEDRIQAYRIELTTGEKISYWLEAFSEGTGGPVMGDGYKASVIGLIEMSGKIYSTSDMYGALWVGNAKSGHLELLKVAGGNQHYYHRLYTDGSRLFAWYDNGIVELVISDDGIKEKPLG